jgi:preprotein translocase subunit Sec63
VSFQSEYPDIHSIVLAGKIDTCSPLFLLIIYLMFSRFLPRRHIQLPNRGVLGSDPYTVLGVTRGSSMKEVKREYYKLAKKFHPDMNPDDERAK